MNNSNKVNDTISKGIANLILGLAVYGLYNLTKDIPKWAKKRKERRPINPIQLDEEDFKVV